MACDTLCHSESSLCSTTVVVFLIREETSLSFLQALRDLWIPRRYFGPNLGHSLPYPSHFCRYQHPFPFITSPCAKETEYVRSPSYAMNDSSTAHASIQGHA